MKKHHLITYKLEMQKNVGERKYKILLHQIELY